MIEKKEEISTDSRGKWKYWQMEIANAQEYRKKWESEVADYYEIYRNEACGTGYATNRYNIMWANIQTLRPLVYSNLPLADIRRRYADKDVNGRTAAIMLERGVNYFGDKSSLGSKLANVRDDGLIAGMGTLKVRFKAEIEKIQNPPQESGEIEGGELEETYTEELVDKRIEYDFIDYKDFLESPCRGYQSLRWRAFRHRLTREELLEITSKEIAGKVNLQANILENIDKVATEQLETEIFKRAEVWEIWDKTSGKVIFWTAGYTDGLLSEEEDVYKLENFFPCPDPVNMGYVNGSILPVPPYRMYKSQAEELNRVTARLTDLIDQVQAGGLYNAILESKTAEDLLNAQDGTYKPAKFDPSININNLIYNKDIVAIVNVIRTLEEQKQEIINEIREITGLSDIVRGTSVASETATAQQIKGNFAISRIQTQQQAMTNFIRDVIRMTAELLAEHFTGEELCKIAGIKIISQEQIDRKILLLAAREGLSPEEINKVKSDMLAEQEKITKLELAVSDKQLEEIMETMRDDKLRSYTIDIESETTAQFDADKLKGQRIEFMTAMGNFIAQFAPMLQAGLIPPEALKAMIGFVARPFKVGRELEDAFDTVGQPPEQEQPKGPSPEMIDAQLRSRELDIKERKVETDAAVEMAKIEADSIEGENERENQFTMKELAAIAKINAGGIN